MSWSALDTGVRSDYDPASSADLGRSPPAVDAIAALGNGELLVGGPFTMVGDVPSNGFARWAPRPECPADFNCSGNLTTQDIFEFLNAWFAGNTSGDFNESGAVSVQDVLDFLSAWLGGC